ncbi:MAG: hypothetical protein V4461_13140 [Pseudomonadota bacterium]
MRKQFAVLDAPLLQLSPVDHEDVRTACTHKLILGTTGSGKSSTSYKYAVIAALMSGAGGFFCIAKPEDADAIRAYCAQAGRPSSLIDWDGYNYGFNVLAYELARTSNINNVIDLLLAMFEIVRGSGTDPGKSGDQFWRDSSSQLLKASVPIVYGATGTVRVNDLLAFIRGAPSSSAEMRDPQWQTHSMFARMFDAAARRLAEGPIPGFDTETGQRAMDYWREFSGLDAKTQGNIRVSATTLLSRFESGILKSALCADINLFPAELMMSGAIILMNMPVQVHGDDGAILQKIVKHIVYKAILTRNAMPEAMRSRPLIIGADECQNFLFRDAEFLAQCRSSLTMVVMATQSLPTLYAKIGGDHPHDRAHYFASAFNTVVLHSSACAETNDWFAKKLGRTLHRRQSYGQGESGGQNLGMSLGESSNWGSSSSYGSSASNGAGGVSTGTNASAGTSTGGGDNWGRSRGSNSGWNSSHSWAEQSDWVLDPGFFARDLLTGGTQNRGRVTAILFRAGACFTATDSNFLMLEFQQS